MTQALHFAVETDSYIWDGYQPACGDDFRHVKMLTDDPAEVDCPVCRELYGFDALLTEVHGDPFRANASHRAGRAPPRAAARLGHSATIDFRKGARR